MAATESHPTSRQRGESRRPSGKRRGKKVAIVPAKGTHIQAGNQAITSPAGKAPGLATSASKPYSVARAWTAMTSPPPEKTQPRGLLARREARRAPTVEKDTANNMEKPRNPKA